MARRRKNKHSPRKHLTVAEKEIIVQQFAAGLTQQKIADDMGISRQTVWRVLKDVPSAEVSQARAEIALKVASKLHKSIDRTFDAITDDDLEKASLLQKATTIGIFSDKLAAIEQYRRLLAEAHQSKDGGTVLPDDAKALIAMVANRVKKIEVLRMELRDPVTDELVGKASKLMEEAQRQAEAEEVDFEVVDSNPTDLRNPGKE